MIETGTVRSKNTINVAMKNLIDSVFGIIFFWIIGFGFMYGVITLGIKVRKTPATLNGGIG